MTAPVCGIGRRPAIDFASARTYARPTMRADLPQTLPLVCPRCRTASAGERRMFTLTLGRAWRRQGDEVLDGELECENPLCRTLYPVIDGIPLVMADLAAAVSAASVGLLLDRPPPTLAALARAAGEGSPLVGELEYLSTYLDAHYGDRASPPPDLPPGLPAFGFAGLASCLRADRAPPARSAVELGCGVGRGLLELSRSARQVVGVDRNFGALRSARALLLGQPLEYARRQIGRHYQTATIPGLERASEPAPHPPVVLVCADALDPPLVPGHFDRVCALNLLDAVASPTQVLSVADGLLEEGGELLLSAPFSWRDDLFAEPGLSSTGDPAAWLRRALEGGIGLEASYVLEEAREVAWTLRRDARSATVYQCHLVRARKRAPAG